MYKGDIDGEAKPKISFPLLFAFRRGVRGEPQKSKEIFGFAARPKGARPRRFQRDRSVQCSFKPPRTRSVRIQFRSKKVRAKDMITPQIETSCSERAGGFFCFPPSSLSPPLHSCFLGGGDLKKGMGGKGEGRFKSSNPILGLYHKRIYHLNT